MKQLATMEFSTSTNKYSFEVYSYNTDFDDYISAVYVVTRRYLNTTGKYSHDIIYIGQTNDVKSRFADHDHKRCFDSYKASSICIYRLNSESDRRTLEEALIKYNKPPCNDQHT